MTSYKNIEPSSGGKYGETQKGIYAKEKIQPGEMIRHCVCGANDGKYTRNQLLDIIQKSPNLEDFIRSFSYMVDDDIYQLASKYKDKIVNDECSYFNHTCDPNCGFDSTGHGYVALKVIEAGDEIAYHYGFLETEMSLIYGLECKCGSKSCEGILKFENYRDDRFVQKYYEYFTPYLRQKAKDMKERWYSNCCYVKRVPTTETNNIREWKTCLSSYKDIKKDDLVASFSSYDKINENEHFIRHSKTPNCYLKGKNVYASENILAEAELTLFFN